tara:strand:- start:22491 stop:22802 length:312 start_codon:yes stop_codon:yes gene_type:complete
MLKLVLLGRNIVFTPVSGNSRRSSWLRPSNEVSLNEARKQIRNALVEILYGRTRKVFSADVLYLVYVRILTQAGQNLFLRFSGVVGEVHVKQFRWLRWSHEFH